MVVEWRWWYVFVVVRIWGLGCMYGGWVEVVVGVRIRISGCTYGC